MGADLRSTGATCLCHQMMLCHVSSHSQKYHQHFQALSITGSFSQLPAVTKACNSVLPRVTLRAAVKQNHIPCSWMCYSAYMLKQTICLGPPQ